MKLSRFATLSAAIVLGATSAHAQSAAPVPSPTIITSLPYTIGSAGYYQLGADLTSAATSGALITINANNVTLDFGGHFISGPVSLAATQNSTLLGVTSTDHNNLIIENGTISHCYQCVTLVTSNTTLTASAGTLNTNQLLNNMLLNFPYRTGAYFLNTTGARVTNCRIANVGGSQIGNGTGTNLINCAIQLDGGIGYEFADNTITNANVGINDAEGVYAVARRNTLIGCSTGLISVTKYQDTLTANVETLASGDGVDAGGNF